ncbi:MAG: DUF975 family protein [Clostridiales bacterium]|jgi:uncharacterized membrane protein|nr:DUF975 family protein [Clostridiales bacterium]
MPTRAELKMMAKLQLRGRWGSAIGAILIVGLISLGATFLAAIPLVGAIAFFVFMSVISLGITAFFVKMSRGQNVEIGEVFQYFSFWRKSSVLLLLITVFTWLWALLFIIPGIVAAYRYRMAFYILLDNPEISASEALRRSKEMMRGHKAELFVQDLSFLGWALLCGFTCGLGYLVLAPYMTMTECNYYNKLSRYDDNFEADGYEEAPYAPYTPEPEAPYDPQRPPR